MGLREGETPANLAQIYLDRIGMWGEHRPSLRQLKMWRPPTDVYETDEHVVVKVEVAGMQQEELAVTLEARKLTISGVRHDPAAKLGYQQMEIQYGYFETHVHLSRAIDEENVEATYQDGFLSVRLLKARPRRVPIVDRHESA